MSWRAYDLFVRWFGYSLPTDLAESDFTVGLTALRIANANARRVKLRVTVVGNDNIIVAPSNQVTALKGVMIGPSQTLELDWQEDYDAVTEELWAISAFAGNTVHVIEDIMTGADDR